MCIYDFTPVLHYLLLHYSQSDADGLSFEFSMSALTLHLKKHAETNPNASYFNVDILKYHVSDLEYLGNKLKIFEGVLETNRCMSASD